MHSLTPLADPFWSAGLNSLASTGLICLACCANNGCVDDDYDDETGYCAKHGGYNEKWRVECEVDKQQVGRVKRE